MKWLLAIVCWFRTHDFERIWIWPYHEQKENTSNDFFICKRCGYFTTDDSQVNV